MLRDVTFHKYRPVGRCIYCDTTDNGGEPLSSEHIIPKNLGGYAEIRAASCRNCAKETHAFEGVCAETIFKRVRYLRGLKKTPYKPIPLTIFPDSGEKTIAVPIENMPFGLQLPAMTLPGIIAGHDLDHWPNAKWLTWRNPDTTKLSAAIEDKTWTKYVYNTEFPTSEFCRLLAKIAHCHLTAELGHGQFTPYLIDTILGKSRRYPFLVGGYTDIPPAPKVPVHEVSTFRPPWPSSLLGVEIRLFSELGTPIYLVIGGELPAEAIFTISMSDTISITQSR